MSESKPKPGSFTAYLEYAHRNQRSAQSSSMNPPNPPSPITLISILAALDPPSLPMAELESRSAMDPMPYREALKYLSETGNVEIEGTPLEAVVHLTIKGSDAARLARPA
jgi:hypothetical protein